MLRREGTGGTVLEGQPLVGILGDRPLHEQTAVGHGENFRLAFYPVATGIEQERVPDSLSLVERITGEIPPLLSALSRPIREHLQLPDRGNWWRIVFHLGWHFPRPFLRPNRYRLLTQNGKLPIYSEETDIQLYGTNGLSDLLPGLIYSELEHDLCTSSEAALGVIIELLERQLQTEVSTFPETHILSVERRQNFDRIRSKFLAAAQMPMLSLECKLLKVANSFGTPPASEWANFERGGCAERLLHLSRLNDAKEIAQIRGPATEWFCELAQEAGSALPASVLDSPILFDGIERGFSGSRPVTNRGALEKWVGFVFTTLKRHGHKALHIWWGTQMGPRTYGFATFDRDLCAASVLAIDLAKLTTAAEEAAKRERASCSPFSVPSMEEQGYQWAEDKSPPPPPPANYTLGQLLDDLQRFGEDYHQSAENIPQEDPTLHRYFQIQLGAFVSRMRDRLQRIPGFTELQEQARSLRDGEISFSVSQLIVDALVQRSNGSLSVSAAKCLTLAEAASCLNSARNENDLTAPTDPEDSAKNDQPDRGIGSFVPPPAPPVPPPAPPATCGLTLFDLQTVFRCAVELAEAVALVPRHEWENVPIDIEGPTSPHLERWMEWRSRLDRIKEESERLKRSLGAIGPLTFSGINIHADASPGEGESARWESYRRRFADTSHDRIVRLALMKLSTAAIDLSGFATWRTPQWEMRESGLRLLAWGLAQLWEGMTAAERSAVQDRLQRAHKAVGWPRDRAIWPSAYDGPEGIPVEDQHRVIDFGRGYIACCTDYLNDRQTENIDRSKRRHEGFLRRMTLGQFVQLAEEAAKAMKAKPEQYSNVLEAFGEIYTKAFWSLSCLGRAKEFPPREEWPDEALKQRNLLADAAELLLVHIGGTSEARSTLKPEDVEKAFGDFTTSTNRLREFANRESTQTQSAAALSPKTIAEQTPAPRTTRSLQSRKEPSEDAFAAYRLLLVTGNTQTELAKNLTTELKRPVNQGAVSRWIRQVRDWLEAGNVLPDLTANAAKKPTTMDPERIDLGPNREHRPQHQRKRRTSDRDE